jgi:hypothetical protein
VEPRRAGLNLRGSDQISGRLQSTRMSKDESEKPQSEVEIIPPDRVHDHEMRRAARLWSDGVSYQRIYVGRIGPLGLFLFALAGSAIAILLFLFVIGAFLIWIPIVGLMVAALILSGLLRSMFRRPR